MTIFDLLNLNLEQFRGIFIYFSIGLAGAAYHWAKKRYIDHTTAVTFLDYLEGNAGSTLMAVCSILIAEATIYLALNGSAWMLTNLALAATTGYTIDSTVNRAPKD